MLKVPPLIPRTCIFSLKCLKRWRLTFMKWTSGVNFLYDFCSAKFIEITLSYFAVRRCPTFSLQIRAKNFKRKSETAKIAYEKLTPGLNRSCLLSTLFCAKNSQTFFTILASLVRQARFNFGNLIQ